MKSSKIFSSILIVSLALLSLNTNITLAASPNYQRELKIVDSTYFKKEINASYTDSDIGISIYDDSFGDPKKIDTATVTIYNTFSDKKETFKVNETDRESNEYKGIFRVKVPGTEKEFKKNDYFIGLIDGKNRDTVKVSYSYDDVSESWSVSTKKEIEKEILIIWRAQLQVSPSRIFFHVKDWSDPEDQKNYLSIDATPGTTVEKEVLLSNVGDDDAYYTYWFEDFYKDEKDNVKYFQSGELNDPDVKKLMMSEWIKVQGPTRVFLKAKEQKSLKLILTIPEWATVGGKYAALIFKQDKTSNQEIHTGEPISVNQEFAILMTANIGKKEDIKMSWNITWMKVGVIDEKTKELSEKSRFFIESLSWSKLPVGVSVKFKNDGNAPFKPEWKVKIKNMLGMTVVENDFLVFERAFPAVVKTYNHTFTSDKGFWFWPYSIELNIKDGNGKDIKSDSISIQSYSYSGIITVVVWLFSILGLSIFVIVKRRRNTK